MQYEYTDYPWYMWDLKGVGQERAHSGKERESRVEWRNQIYGLDKDWRGNPSTSKSTGFALPERKKHSLSLPFFLCLCSFDLLSFGIDFFFQLFLFMCYVVDRLSEMFY